MNEVRLVSMVCAECGMTTGLQEYHPFAACLMFKACHNAITVRDNLAAVRSEEREACAIEAEIFWSKHPDQTHVGRQTAVAIANVIRARK